jgi:hypothetical protein
MGIVDLSWIRDLGLAVRRESGSMVGHEWVLLSFPETSVHHDERCLWRLVVFAKAWHEPRFSIDLERDILGDFCLSLHEGANCRILDRYGSAPRYEAFRRLALAELGRRLAIETRRVGAASVQHRANR